MSVQHLHETETRWFAIRTRPRCEKSVRQHLERSGITAYVPLQIFVRHYERKTRTVALPLIAGYVFVKINKSQYVGVLATPNVNGFIKSGPDLLSIPDDEIDVLRRITLEKDLEVAALPGTWLEGDQVEIAAGTLAGLKGRLVSFAGKKQVQITLDRLDYRLLLTLDPGLLRKINAR